MSARWLVLLLVGCGVQEVERAPTPAPPVRPEPAPQAMPEAKEALTFGGRPVRGVAVTAGQPWAVVWFDDGAAWWDRSAAARGPDVTGDSFALTPDGLLVRTGVQLQRVPFGAAAGESVGEVGEGRLLASTSGRWLAVVGEQAVVMPVGGPAVWRGAAEAAGWVADRFVVLDGGVVREVHPATGEATEVGKPPAGGPFTVLPDGSWVRVDDRTLTVHPAAQIGSEQPIPAPSHTFPAPIEQVDWLGPNRLLILGDERAWLLEHGQPVPMGGELVGEPGLDAVRRLQATPR